MQHLGEMVCLSAFNDGVENQIRYPQNHFHHFKDPEMKCRIFEIKGGINFNIFTKSNIFATTTNVHYLIRIS